MKKLILLFFLSIRCFSQQTIIDSLSKYTACIGDSITVYLSDTGNWGSPTMVTVNYGNTNPYSYNTIYSHTYIYDLQHGSKFTFNLYYASQTTINNKVYIETQSGSIKYIQVNNCSSDIHNYNSKEDLISTEYYNLLGQPIKEPEGITVEVKTFRDGYRKVSKILK